VRPGLALALCWATPLVAQTGPAVRDQKIWTLEGLRAGYCIRFLTSPKRAEDRVRSGFTLVRADQDSSLHPALRQVIQSQPEYGSWVPSDLCFYYTDAVRVGDRRIVEHNARNAQMLGIWTIAAVEQGSGKPRALALGMYASRDRLRAAAATNLIRLDEVETGFRAGSDTTGEEYRQKIGKTQLVWNGRAVGQQSPIDQPLTDAWSVPGSRRVTWSADFSLSPAWARPLVGSLRVEGKGDLADDLRSSPIRFVGPFYRGGEGQLRFTR
jgi:hypothetical protein